MRVPRPVATWLGLVLTASLVVTVQPGSAGAAEQWPQRKPAPPYLVETAPVPVKALPPDTVLAASGGGSPAASWPSGGAAEVQVRSASQATEAGGLPVWVGPPSSAAAAGAHVPPAAVRVQVLDHAASVRQGVAGLVLRLRRSDGQATAGTISVKLRYSGFRDVYGGDWAARLRLLELPAAGPATPVASRNDLKAGQLSADVTVTGTDSTFAIAAGPSGETGDYKATSLAPSGTWAVATQSGDFEYSYPFRVPSVPGDLTPKLSLAYSSGSVDGRTAATNNQPSWVGEGWSLWPGSIERRYRSCFDDNTVAAQKTGDECWGTNGSLLDNATLSLDGHATPLVYAGNNTWRPKDDDGSRVQRLSGAANGDQGDAPGDTGEYWKVTTTDGTQYLFGRSTTSAWTVPVFGNDTGEPCHRSTFDASWCQQAYRWNLDQVIDTHGNIISYFYTPETNNYARNFDGAKATPYVRGGVLEHVEYGARAGQGPVARVLFTAAERGGPDVPSDQACPDGQNCGTHYSPTFWSTKRLSSVTTQVWDGAWHDLDRWTLGHAYPANTDGTTASLWLHDITHTGLAASPNVVGQSVTLPTVVFDGQQLPNRLNSDWDQAKPLNKWRIVRIVNETGGWIDVTYLASDCVPSQLPTMNPQGNTKRCFPVTWTPEGNPEIHDWMAKYVVGSVDAIDRVGGQQTEVNSYDYGTGAVAWHYDDDPVLPDRLRTWSQYRGFGDVVVRHGKPADVTPSATRYTYFRGMGGAPVRDSQGGTWPDDEQLAGFLREQQTYNGAGGPVLSSTINDPFSRQTAAQWSLKSYIVQTDWTVTRTALQAADGSLRGWRTTKLKTEYTNEGLPWKVNDLGDDSTAADDRCTTTTYVRNDGSWLLDLPAEIKVDGVACTTTPVYPRDAVSDTRTYYDNATSLTTPPSAGNATRVDQVKEYVSGQPSWVTISHGSFDAYGRPRDSYDALNRKASTSYSPTTGLPTSQSETSPPVDPSAATPATMTTTTSLDPVLGQPVTVTDANGRDTDLTYDALGRLLGVWRPGRSKDNGDGPSERYAYRVRADGPSWVSTDTLEPNNNYLTSYQLYDGFLRERQTQSLGPNPDSTKPPVRVLTDTLYDSRGLAFQRNDGYFDSGTPGTTLATVDNNDVPRLLETSFDGAERPTTTVLKSRGNQLASQTTRYFGDHTEFTPPTGGTPTATFTDAREQTSEVWQFKAATPSGTHTTTRYGYTHAGKLATVNDTAGNVWRYDYDLLGRQTAKSDPDKGDSTSTYDDAGQLTSTRDARGITLAYKYDGLGRKIEEHQDSLGGPTLASWTYDTILKGQLTSSTRTTGTETVTRAVTGYDTAYRPTGTRISVPGAPAPLNRDWVTSNTYKPDGSPDTVTLPSLPLIAPEKLTWKYDSLGMPFELKGEISGTTVPYVVDTAYTEFGELSQLLLGASPNQALQTFYFDMGTRRLTQAVEDLQHDQLPDQPPRSVQDLNYTYDPAGNLTRLADTPTLGAADKQCFTYDPLRRLREAWATTADTCGTAGANPGGPAPYWTSYTFDDVGNRTTDTTHAVSSGAGTNATRTLSYPAAGQRRPHAVSTVSGAGASTTSAYDYDPAGNTISRPGPGGTQTLTWTPQGKLSTVTVGSSVTTNQYDADTDLLLTKDPSGTTLYLDGAEVRVSSTGQTSATRYYTFSGATIGARTSSGGLSWLVHDYHGTDNLAVKAADSTATVRRSDPFGNPRGTQASWPGSHGFVGGVTQPIGVTHLGAREYDPQLGKFLSVDPVMDLSDPQQFNAYAYANNNPSTMSDPDGLKVFEGDSGGWSDSGAYRAPAPARPPATPARPPVRSTAYRNDPGARCPTGEAAYCREVAARAKGATRAAKHDPGSRKEIDPEWFFSPETGKLPLDYACHPTHGVYTESKCSPEQVALALDLEEGRVGQRDPIFEFLWELTPLATLEHCLDGSDSCAWLAAEVVPGGRFIKAARDAKKVVADERAFGRGGMRAPKAPSSRQSRHKVDAGTYKTRDEAWAAANRDSANYKWSQPREECSKGCHVHLDIYNNWGQLLEVRHYTYQQR